MKLAGKRCMLRLLVHPAFLNGVSLRTLNTTEYKVSLIIFFLVLLLPLNFRATHDKSFVRI
jgi:hypothetical protein